MAVTARDLIANGVKPAYAENLAAKINSLDPAVQNRYANTVVQFYREYGSQGYDLDINQAARTAAEQRSIRATGVKAASPRNTWHVGGGAADFTVYKNGKRDTGTRSGNAYQTILAPIAKANGLANPIRNDVGHFQPVEFSLSRRGQSVAAAIDPAKGAYPSLFGRDPLTMAANVPLPTPRPTQVAALAPEVTGDALAFAPTPAPSPAQRAAAEEAVPNNGQVAAYIQQAALSRGIDPGIALRVAQSEGLNDLTTPESGWQSRVSGERSFGPYQLYTGGGLGNEFQRATGLDPRDPSTVYRQVDFALDHAAENGWGDFHGAARVGIGRTEGIGPEARAIGVGEQAWLANPAMVNIPADAPYGASAIINAAMGGDPAALKAALDTATQAVLADMTGAEKVGAMLGTMPERIIAGIDTYQRSLVENFPSVMRMAQTQLNANRQLAAAVPQDMRQRLQATFAELPPVPTPTPRPATAAGPTPARQGTMDVTGQASAGGMAAPTPLSFSGVVSRQPEPSWNKTAADALRQVSRLFAGGGSSPPSPKSSSLQLPAYSPQPSGPEDWSRRQPPSTDNVRRAVAPPDPGLSVAPQRQIKPAPALPAVATPAGRLSPEYVKPELSFGKAVAAVPTADRFLAQAGFVGAGPMATPLPTIRPKVAAAPRPVVQPARPAVPRRAAMHVAGSGLVGRSGGAIFGNPAYVPLRVAPAYQGSMSALQGTAQQSGGRVQSEPGGRPYVVQSDSGMSPWGAGTQTTFGTANGGTMTVVTTPDGHSYIVR